MSDDPKGRRLTAKEVRSLLARTSYAPDAEIKRIVPSPTNPLRLADGKLLVVSRDGRGNLYDDRDAVVRWLQGTAARPPRHLLDDRFLHDDQFPNEVSELIARLADAVGIDAARFDGSVTSLTALDERIRKMGSSRFLRAPLFGCLVAYVGEVVRRETGLEWELRQSGTVWEPWIVATGQRGIPIFARIWDELHERTHASMSELAQALISLAKARRL
jgi:hypothetical protein